MFKPIFSAMILSTTLLLSACHSTAINSQNIHSTSLQTQRWTLTHLGMNTLSSHAQALPYLQFDAASKRISGSDGCNRIMASYQLNNDQLHFSQLASTKMMCMDANMLLASQFTEALGQVASYKIESHTLKLLDAQGQLLMQLSSQPVTQQQ